MISKKEIDDALKTFIVDEKARKLSDFKYYTACRREYDTIQNALDKLNLTEIYQNNKYNTSVDKFGKIKYTNDFLKKQVEDFYAEKGDEARTREFKYYAIIRYRFGSYEAGIKALNADVDIKKYSSGFAENVTNEEIKNEYKEYLLKKINGEDANFARRTLAMYRFGTTQIAMETMQIYALDLLEKVKRIVEKRKHGKMTKKEEEFINYLSSSISDFVKKNY